MQNYYCYKLSLRVYYNIYDVYNVLHFTPKYVRIVVVQYDEYWMGNMTYRCKLDILFDSLLFKSDTVQYHYMLMYTLRV